MLDLHRRQQILQKVASRSREHAESLEKISVNLNMLRKATQELGGNVIRAGVDGLKIIGRKASEVLGAGEAGRFAAPDGAFGIPKFTRGLMKQREAFVGHVSGLGPVAAAEHVRNVNLPLKPLQGKIIWGANPFKAIKRVLGDAYTGPQSLTGAGRETLNRSLMLHEATEAGKHHGIMPMGSHLSTRPVFRDLNIAATLKGPGSDAADALRGMRGMELRALHGAVPGTKDLNLGHSRVNRHQIKRIQEAYDRNIIDPVRREKLMEDMMRSSE